MKPSSNIEAYLATMLAAPRVDRVERDHADTMIRYLEGAIESAELLSRQSSSEPIRQLAQDIALSHRRSLEMLRDAIGTPFRERCIARGGE